MNKKMKSPLRYPGGKTRAIKQIMPMLPTKIGEYREPFIGGGSVYFAVRNHFAALNQFWINDLNYDLVCFWEAVKTRLDDLAEAVWRYKADFGNGRDLYEHLRDDERMKADLDRAVRFFIMNRITFSGIMDAGGYSQQAFERRFTESSIQRLENLAGALDQTRITHGDYAALMTAEGQDVFIFLDPPYLSVTKSRLYGKGGELHTSFDHQRFAEVMQACPHRWLITYDDSPEVRQLFGFATIVEWELQYGMNNYKQGSAAKGKELFIKNY